MYTSVQRVTTQNEICKRTPFVISTVQQFLLSKTEQILNDDDMVTLLRAVKCSEAWLKYVRAHFFYESTSVCHKFVFVVVFAEMEVFHSTIVRF